MEQALNLVLRMAEIGIGAFAAFIIFVLIWEAMKGPPER